MNVEKLAELQTKENKKIVQQVFKRHGKKVPTLKTILILEVEEYLGKTFMKACADGNNVEFAFKTKKLKQAL